MVTGEPLPQLELRLTSEHSDSLSTAAQQMRRFLTDHQVDARACYAADLALEELGTNFYTHAYPFGTVAGFTLQILVHPHHIEQTFIDDAPPFDPTSVPEPARAQSLEEAAIGGLGIHMVRKACTKMSYVREACQNRLTLQIARNP